VESAAVASTRYFVPAMRLVCELDAAVTTVGVLGMEAITMVSSTEPGEFELSDAILTSKVVAPLSTSAAISMVLKRSGQGRQGSGSGAQSADTAGRQIRIKKRQNKSEPHAVF